MTSNGSSTALADTISDFEQVPSIRTLQDKIDRLQISADAKALLMDLAKVTLAVGGKVLAFGRKLLAFVLELANRFQNVLFGILIALALSAVLATLPLLGPAISALLTPLMVAARDGRVGMAELLLDAGARVDLVDHSGQGLDAYLEWHPIAVPLPEGSRAASLDSEPHPDEIARLDAAHEAIRALIAGR